MTSLRFAPAPISAAVALLLTLNSHAQVQNAPATVPGSVDNGSLREVTVTAPVSDVARSGLFGDRKVLETPFSVTGFTEQLIRDQQARQLRDVLVNDASVRSTGTQNAETETFQIRGLTLQANEVSYDGIYGLHQVRTSGLAYAERVEVFKGPNAVINGLSPFGSVGGAVNIVPKRAGADPVTDLTLHYATAKSLGAQVDVGRRFGPDNALGVRFNAIARGGETQIDGTKNQYGTADLSLDYKSRGFKATADFGYQKDDLDAGQQGFSIAPGLAVPAAPKGSENLSQSWGRVKSDDKRFLLGVSYDLNDQWTASARYGQLAHREDFQTPTQVRIINAAGDFTYRTIRQPADFDTRTSDIGLKGKFNTGPVRHELALNATHFYADNQFAFLTFGPTLTSNIYAPVASPAPSFAGTPEQARPGNERTLRTVAVADTMYLLNDALQVTLGLRHQSIKITNFVNASGNAPGTVASVIDQSKVSPVAAILYKLNTNWSVYGNATQGLASGPQAPGGTANAGTVLSPIVAKSYELGMKADYGKWGAGAAVFQTTQQAGITNPITNVFAADGQNRVRGLELNVFGSPQRSLSLLGGVTFLDAVQTRTAGGVNDGKKAVSVPELQATLFAEWRPQGVRGLSLNSRLLYVDKQFVDVANTQSIPAWTRVDLGVKYVYSGPTPVTLRATVENVADKDYWSAARNSVLARGGPRTLFVSSEINF